MFYLGILKTKISITLRNNKIINGIIVSYGESYPQFKPPTWRCIFETKDVISILPPGKITAKFEDGTIANAIVEYERNGKIKIKGFIPK
jgi:hypothetical protein